MATERPLPATIEICPRCRVHIMWVGACYHCGFKGTGIPYVIADEPATSATTPGDKE